MPGKDSTGPTGQGLKTGKGQGKCGQAKGFGKGAGCNRTGGKQGSCKGGGSGKGRGRA